MVCRNFYVALICYLNPLLCVLLLIMKDAQALWYSFGILFSFAPLFSIVKPTEHGVLYRAYFIGTVASAGLILCKYSDDHKQLGAYLLGLSFFHISEYLLTALYKEKKLSYDSFLLNHSTAYHIALTIGLVEYLITYVNLYEDKFYAPIYWTGGVMMIAGDTIRKLAMITAADNFDHIVQDTKASDHRLVTHGVYSISRHPSYMGWFYWAVATQLLLCNPVCTCLYAYAAWKFFSERIEEEEYYLLQFFRGDYVHYKETVGVGIPGIRGYEIASDLRDQMLKKNE